MIDPRELRIGNYISYYIYDQQNPYPDRIKSIYFGDESKEYRLEMESGKFSLGHLTIQGIKPIPLTEDILMKCGFKRKENFCNRDHFCLYYNHFYIDVFHVNHTIQKYIWNIHIDDESFMNVGYGHFDYVHELQNLFYDLCKTPLDIKL